MSQTLTSTGPDLSRGIAELAAGMIGTLISQGQSLRQQLVSDLRAGQDAQVGPA
jgi:hypothetical protein